MVLRILFQQKTKKYPQNTFRVHKQTFVHLCILLVLLLIYSLLI